MYCDTPGQHILISQHVLGCLGRAVLADWIAGLRVRPFCYNKATMQLLSWIKPRLRESVSVEMFADQ